MSDPDPNPAPDAGAAPGRGGGDEPNPDDVAVARLDEIPPVTGKAVLARGRAIALFRDGDAVYALDVFCPHRGETLHDGLVFEKVVACRHHGWRFSLETGCWLSNRRTAVQTYPVRVVDGVVRVAIPPDPAD